MHTALKPLLICVFVYYVCYVNERWPVFRNIFYYLCKWKTHYFSKKWKLS